jgi:hypothetical protein
LFCILVFFMLVIIYSALRGQPRLAFFFFPF